MPHDAAHAQRVLQCFFHDAESPPCFVAVEHFLGLSRRDGLKLGAFSSKVYEPDQQSCPLMPPLLNPKP